MHKNKKKLPIKYQIANEEFKEKRDKDFQELSRQKVPMDTDDQEFKLSDKFKFITFLFTDHDEYFNRFLLDNKYYAEGKMIWITRQNADTEWRSKGDFLVLIFVTNTFVAGEIGKAIAGRVKEKMKKTITLEWNPYTYQEPEIIEEENHDPSK